MQTYRLIRLCFVVLLLTCFPTVGQSQELQTGSKDQGCASIDNLLNFGQWINCRVDAAVALRMNQKGMNKQVEVPSIGSNTTSLVDQTEAPDLLGLGLNLIGMKKNGGTEDDDNEAISVTTSAYALYAALTRNDALDPRFYLEHQGLRRLSFTMGQDEAEEASDETNRAFLFGFKYMIINKRDASLQSNRDELKKVSQFVGPAGMAVVNIQPEVEDYLFTELGKSLGYPAIGEADVDAKIRFITQRLTTANDTKATLKMLSPKQLSEVLEIVSAGVDAQVALRQVTTEVFEKIRRRPQLSFSFQTKQHRAEAVDEYRSGLLLDLGVYQRLNLALNATFDYEDSKLIGGDKRGGRFAGEGYFHLTDQNIFGGKDPLVMSIAGEGKWRTSAKPTYTGQVKLTIPLFDGINLPISFSVANRSDLIDESTVRGRFGFTFDLAKLLQVLP